MEIHVELEDLSSVKKCLKVEVPADRVQQAYNEVAGHFKRHARLPGFRKGKAPVSLVKRHFRKSIRSEVIEKLIPESLKQAVDEQGLRPLGQPSLGKLSFEEGQPLVYEAHIEIPPRITLPRYKGLKVAAEQKPVTDEDVDAEIERLRDQHSRLVAVEDRGVREGDYAVVDLEGEYLDVEEGEEAPEPIRDENVVVQVGEERTHQAFNDNLVGMNLAEEKEFEVTYPDEYPEEKLAGQRVRFRVRLNDLKLKELPDLDDDFARDLGEYETLADLRRDLEEKIAEARARNRDAELRNRLVEQLLGEASFEVPDTLVESRIDSMIHDMAYRMAYQGVDPSRANLDWARVRAEARPDAERYVRANLLLAEIAKAEGVEVSGEDLDAELEKAARSMEQPIEKVRQYFQQEGRMGGLEQQIARQKALDLLLEHAAGPGLKS